MDISVVIATHNQVERLTLVLQGLAHQTLQADFEVIVVDDGCTDGTRRMLAELDIGRVSVIGLKPNQGRNRARNRGIEAARGELVVFLDGDALPAPDLLQRYWQAYQKEGSEVFYCGHAYCLSDLEYFQDPQTGTLGDWPMPSVLADRLIANRGELVVDKDMVRDRFELIEQRAVEGGYPFPALQEYQGQVFQLLETYPAAESGWVGFVPHNAAIPAALLAEGGGFDEEISFSEGWELAYRLQRNLGAELRAVDARSYHLYHYHDFARPEEGDVRYRAIEHMVAKYQDERIRLLYFWLAALWPDPDIPELGLVPDLLEFEKRYLGLSPEEWRDYQLVLEHHPRLSQYTEVRYEQCA
ncbi:MAG: glycosyltransferase family 2 protein [Gemmatimonadetes bacterium]|jgi:glycosyltransferase involved in cell wall biosynthesis|nr:glycosyltransferase family 2 protein [Gemmatimonadota bacterium]MBT5327746.1 glycosyltransferase family 2 protein [Gemmatimonadota bacterium]MBT5453097.1 glycosyltransferase family 2 protein [Gemmatimonadota bacterium]MBT5802070.1 glycosyltransferase family 2 protein [Gemmatimonadota bacterium]MBT6622486.1 glycosyltransferase family 2 protein [Gemmatimonadota bacterium]